MQTKKCVCMSFLAKILLLLRPNKNLCLWQRSVKYRHDRNQVIFYSIEGANSDPKIRGGPNFSEKEFLSSF